MTKRLISVFITAISLSLLMACSTDDDDFLGKENEFVANQTELYKAWQLIGYGSEGSFHMIDEEYRKKSETYGYRFWIAFKSDGTFEGRESINQILGDYTSKGNQIKIGQICSTEIYDAKGNKESEEFLKRLQSSTTYGIKDGKKLRMSYSDKEFLYFEALEE